MTGGQAGGYYGANLSPEGHCQCFSFSHIYFVISYIEYARDEWLIFEEWVG